MTNFCTCGSIIINDHCSNKNCRARISEKSKALGVKHGVSSKSKEVKVPKTRRASKVTTYNLYEDKDSSEKEENVL